MTMEFETPPPNAAPAAATSAAPAAASAAVPTRSPTRRRVVAGLGAAMLVAAAGGAGFGIGRNIDRDDQIQTAAATETDTSDPGNPIDTRDVEESPAATEAPTPDATDEGLAATDAPAATVPAPGRAAAAESAASDTADGGAIASSGGGGWAPFGADEMDVLFERTTDDGISIRAQLGALWPTDVFRFEQDGWQPPGWCFQSGEVRVAMSGDGVIDVGSVGWYVEPYQGRSVSWLTLGRADGNAHRVVFTQVPDGTASVTATFADGSVDQVEPQNGVAVLVVSGPPETIVHDADSDVGGWVEEIPDFTVTFGGTASGTGDVIVTNDQVGTWNDPVFAASCSPPPPSLPDAGEQPADPAAAEAEIVAAMSQLYGGPDDGAGSSGLLDDATGVDAAREQVRSGGFETEASSAEAIVEELVFTTPSKAWFRYRVETGGVGLNERYGIAVEVDGVWLITRATLCQDLAMAGGSCGDDVGTIRPPGAEFPVDVAIED